MLDDNIVNQQQDTQRSHAKSMHFSMNNVSISETSHVMMGRGSLQTCNAGSFRTSSLFCIPCSEEERQIVFGPCEEAARPPCQDIGRPGGSLEDVLPFVVSLFLIVMASTSDGQKRIQRVSCICQAATKGSTALPSCLKRPGQTACY